MVRVWRLLISVVGAFCVATVGASCAKQNDLLACGAAEEQCGRICVNLQDDTENCGKCDTVCAAGQVCAKGACSSECPTGNTKCTKEAGAGVLCVNIKTDNANCGVCGRACKTGEICY